MGKYVATRGFQRDRRYNRSSSLSSVGDSLFGIPTNKGDFQFQAFVAGADPTGLYRGYINARDYGNYWDDYMQNSSVSWSDVKYPSMMMGFGSSGSSAKATFTYISDNVRRLYL